MREVVIQGPTLEVEHNINIQVKIIGKKMTLNCGVEDMEWTPKNLPHMRK